MLVSALPNNEDLTSRPVDGCGTKMSPPGILKCMNVCACHAMTEALLLSTYGYVTIALLVSTTLFKSC